VLKIKNLSVKIGRKRILEDVGLNLREGEIQVLMGPNGSGKTTLAQTLAGRDKLQVTSPPAGEAGDKLQVSGISLDGKNLLKMSVDERVKAGLFVSFQNPVSIGGVKVFDFLWEVYLSLFKRLPHPVDAGFAMTLNGFKNLVLKEVKKLGFSREILEKELSGFSGGERKRLEMLQALVLRPKYVVFDEIDSGVDIDGLEIIKKSVLRLKKNGVGVLLITHQPKVLKFVKPFKIHILVGGKIVKSGNSEILKRLEISGYKSFYCAACICRETECPEHKRR